MQNGIEFSRLDGKMNRKQRELSIQSFSGETSVLLASLMTASLGMNLTTANQVILLDPWWNGSVQDQAIDRVLFCTYRRSIE